MSITIEYQEKMSVGKQQIIHRGTNSREKKQLTTALRVEHRKRGRAREKAIGQLFFDGSSLVLLKPITRCIFLSYNSQSALTLRQRSSGGDATSRSSRKPTT